MKEQEQIDQVFEKFDGQWDQFEPADGHLERFEYRLKSHKSTPSWTYWMSYSAAACILVALSIWFFNPFQTTTPTDSYLSAESRYTDSIFNVSIKYSKAALINKSDKVGQQPIKDALNQLQMMEKDYAFLKDELRKKGESKQLMQALITNLKMQIEFLETVNNAIEEADAPMKKPNYSHEQTI